MTSIDCPEVRGSHDICKYLGYSINSWKRLRAKLKRDKLLSYDGGTPVLNKQRFSEHSYNRKPAK